MGAGRGRSLCALWGGISLGTGTVAFAFFSPASVGCSTNLIVLTHSTVTARGCAAYSVIAHLGVGLIVLGAVLLLGSFALAVRTRRSTAAAPPVATDAGAVPAATAAAPGVVEPPAPTTRANVEQAPPAAGPTVDDLPLFDGPPAPAPAPATRPQPVSAAPAASVTVAAGDGATWSRPIAPGEDDDGGFTDEYAAEVGLLDSAVRLPPGWYGNPNNPERPVQWWDGTKLTDRPG